MNIFKKFVLLLVGFVLAAAPLKAEEIVIKFATLAPEGSTWMNVMQKWNKDITEKSGGRLKFRIYAGGVSGDEKDVVRKIRLGQLHAGGFTGVGLGEIAPTMRLLDAPFLFQNTDEVDFVKFKFDKDWNDAFSKNGYVLLGWAEVGFVYLFTNQPIDNLGQLKKVKMWMWEGDPTAEAAFKTLGLSPIPLSITDVLTSLQTGLVDGVYGSPLAIVALQWFTRTKYMLDFHLANASGAVLVSKAYFDKMPKDLQALLLSTGKEYMSQLTQASRKENKEAIETLKKNGVTLTQLNPKDAQESKVIGSKARRMLAGKLYSQTLLDNVEKSLEEFRSQAKKPKP